ncbi:MAG TPA: shikimate kinase, partial [Solirubrobacterales bacterium]
MGRSLVFIGFMGAGKSTALAAARDAGLEAIETDGLIEQKAGMKISELFDEHGEEAFRALEAEVVCAALESADGAAVALGGGSVLSEPVRRALADHVVAWLQVDATRAWQRISHSDRPLAGNREGVKDLLAERLPLYEGLADAVVPPGDRGLLVRAMPSLIALTELPAGTRMLWAASASGEYPVFVGKGLLGAGEGRWWPLAGRRFCVSDATVAGRYAETLGP